MFLITLSSFFLFSVYSHFNWLELILFAQASLNILDPQDRGPKVGTGITASTVVGSLGILTCTVYKTISISKIIAILFSIA